MSLDERLVRRDELEDARSFIDYLRAPEDPPAIFIRPPNPPVYARKCEAAANAARFCNEHPEHVVRRGFKLWKLVPESEEYGTLNIDNPYLATAHFVVQNIDTQEYIDVTPATDEREKDDDILFVQSSRLFKGHCSEKIAEYIFQGSKVLMGGVTTGSHLGFKSIFGKELFQETPEGLLLTLKVPFDAMLRQLSCSRKALTKKIKDNNGRVEERGGHLYCIIEADTYESIRSGGGDGAGTMGEGGCK